MISIKCWSGDWKYLNVNTEIAISQDLEFKCKISNYLWVLGSGKNPTAYLLISSMQYVRDKKKLILTLVTFLWNKHSLENKLWSGTINVFSASLSHTYRSYYQLSPLSCFRRTGGCLEVRSARLATRPLLSTCRN